MALQLPVLVRGINNLSDARYCAGMGADGLIFTLDPELPGAIDPATVKELAGWVAGVELIGEFGAADAAQLIAVATACGLDRVLLHQAAPGPLPFPVLQELALADALPTAGGTSPGAVLVSLPETRGAAPASWPQLAALAQQRPLWLGGAFAAADLPHLLATVRPAGLVLQGGDELKPGLRDFAGLEELFEALEAAE